MTRGQGKDLSQTEEDKNEKPQPKSWGFYFVGCVNKVHARKQCIFYKGLQSLLEI